MIRRDHALQPQPLLPITPTGELASRFDTPANRPLRSSSRLTILQIRPAIEGTTDTSHCSSLSTICSDVPPLQPANVLTSLESALTKKVGGGGYPRTPNPSPSSNASPANFRLSTVDCRLSLEFALEMGCIESGARRHSRLRSAQRSAQDFYA